MSYLDFLNDDVVLLIISKLDNMKDIIESSFEIRRLMQNNVNCKVIFKYKDRKLYNYILNLENPDWCRALLYSKLWTPFEPNINQISEKVDTSESSESYSVDILYTYHMSLEFPRFYNQVKDINLNSRDIVDNQRFFWRDIYLLCRELKNYKFINGSFTGEGYASVHQILY